MISSYDYCPSDRFVLEFHRFPAADSVPPNVCRIYFVDLPRHVAASPAAHWPLVVRAAPNRRPTVLRLWDVARRRDSIASEESNKGSQPYASEENFTLFSIPANGLIFRPVFGE